MNFKLVSPYKPTGDQPEAIVQLTAGLNTGVQEQVLLGVTGSGKTFTMANVVANLNKPTLIISHNKTLAAQLFQEFRSFFPQNAVSYFVSYYDYYQPEAYVPQTDTYIEKETEINEEIDKLRLSATTNILTRPDTLVVASVSCIYNLGSPKEYGGFILEMRRGMKVARESILKRLVELQYTRSDFGFHRGTFRVRGDTIDIYPAYQDTGLRIIISDRIESLARVDPLTGNVGESLPLYVLYPAKHYMTDTSKKEVFTRIEADLEKEVTDFRKKGKLIEAQRLEQRVRYDLEMIQEMGYVNGIENYSRYFDGRAIGDPPFTLFEYFIEKYGREWLLFIDESHMTVPQIRGMYHGDRSRKETLINFGFRLQAALDNRPLKFEEFLRRMPQTIYVSATPDEYEISRAKESAQRVILERSDRIPLRFYRPSASRMTNHAGIIEQLVRPTGLVDPEITVRPVAGQIDDLVGEIEKRVVQKERVLVTTLTKRMAEDLAEFLEKKQIKVHYLHSDIVTLERTEILDNLRRGEYDVIVGINLLREGLDLPEVSLVAILDADKEGFLRSRVSLIQTMGRAARHIRGQVIMYADRVTRSMKEAVDEVNRRRKTQLDYNKKRGITPTGIAKPIRDRLVEESQDYEDPILGKPKQRKSVYDKLDIKGESLTPLDKKRLIKQLEREMRFYAGELNFELAAQIRDKIRKLKSD